MTAILPRTTGAPFAYITDVSRHVLLLLNRFNLGDKYNQEAKLARVANENKVLDRHSGFVNRQFGLGRDLARGSINH